jgi:hypothetical protein
MRLPALVTCKKALYAKNSVGVAAAVACTCTSILKCYRTPSYLMHHLATLSLVAFSSLLLVEIEKTEAVREEMIVI